MDTSGLTKMKNLLKLILIALILASASTSAHASVNGVDVYRIVDQDGYAQIAYKKRGIETIVTNDQNAHADPVTDGKMIVWIARVGSLWHIFHHDIAANYTIQLSRVGNNVAPKISNGQVFWEGQRGGVWHILKFDGIKVEQISVGGFPAQDLEVSDSMLAYSQKNSRDEWKIYTYDLQTEESTLVAPEVEGKNPKIEDNLVTWQNQNEETDEMTYYSYDTETTNTFYEGKTSGRKSFFADLEAKLRALKKTQALIKPDGFERTRVDPPYRDPEPVTLEDIKEELDIVDVIPDTPTQENLTEVQETTTSEEN